MANSSSWEYFNPRTREGCDVITLFIFSNPDYFNPRTREGCDLATAWICSMVGISIHAPVKGATSLYRVGFDMLFLYFNPRTREGCDKRKKDLSGLWCTISIHAPVKGATIEKYFYSISFKISIHAPVKGATVHIIPLYIIIQDFNPRTREGCDSRSCKIF